MRKFFTIEAVESDWGTVKLIDDDENVTVNKDYEVPFDAPAVLADKLDGALGIGIVTDDDVLIGTKGSLSSPEAVIGTKVLHDKHNVESFRALLARDYDGFTPVFEIITPSVEHVIDYGSLEDVIFLGLNHEETGHWIPVSVLDEDSLTIGKPNGLLVQGLERLKYTRVIRYTYGREHTYR